MHISLSDLRAPPWRHTLKEKVYDMKPLSLETFADLEGLGVTIGKLQSGQINQWLNLYAFLAGLPVGDDETPNQHLAMDVMTDPLAFKQFQEIILGAFTGSETGEGPTVIRRRQVKDPREVEREQEREREGKPKETDMSFLITVARMSGIPLSELFRMTFRGIQGVQESLQEMPPQNPMSAVAAMFGGGSTKSRK